MNFAAAVSMQDFGRGGRAFDRAHGDPSVKPNPNLGAIEQGPFYAVAMYPGDVGTAGGIVTDEHARVQRADGSVIPGLYATGNATASVMGRMLSGRRREHRRLVRVRLHRRPPCLGRGGRSIVGAGLGNTGERSCLMNASMPNVRTLIEIYRRMTLIKQNDERFRAVIKAGKIVAPYYSPRGQEAIPAAVSVLLTDEDYICTIYRGMHDMLAKGVPLRELCGPRSPARRPAPARARAARCTSPIRRAA